MSFKILFFAVSLMFAKGILTWFPARISLIKTILFSSKSDNYNANTFYSSKTRRYCCLDCSIFNSYFFKSSKLVLSRQCVDSERCCKSIDWKIWYTYYLPFLLISIPRIYYLAVSSNGTVFTLSIQTVQPSDFGFYSLLYINLQTIQVTVVNATVSQLKDGKFETFNILIIIF
jgi:hypothetical protein